MVTKPTKEFTDASGRRKVQGNMDIELATDVMEMVDHLDHVVFCFPGMEIFGGLLIRPTKGAACDRRFNDQITASMIADELRRQADNFLELIDLEPLVSRHVPVRPEERPHPTIQDDLSLTRTLS